MKKCIFCFLSDSHQHKLKRLAQGRKDKYEEVLREYKKLYIDGLNAVVSPEDCESRHHFEPDVVKYLSDIQEDLNTESVLISISDFFDRVINVYTYDAVEKDHNKAFDSLRDFIAKDCYSLMSVSNHDFTKPLFRVRPKGKYDKHNENEYFHIPFSKKEIASSQRYSKAGVPMCYLANNLQTALTEVGSSLDEVNVSVFMLGFSNFYYDKVIETTNPIFENIRISICELYDMGTKLEYDAPYCAFSKRNMKKFLASFILYQVLQYPVRSKDDDYPKNEYLLPQLFMELVRQNDHWIGVKYQSTQLVVSDIGLHHSEGNINYCFWLPQSKDEDYSVEFKSKCIIKLAVNAVEVSLEDFNKKCDEYEDLCRQNNAKGYVMTDYGLYVLSMKRLIGEDKKKVDSGELCQDVFQTEINLLYQLLLATDSIIAHPEKYNFNRWNRNN